MHDCRKTRDQFTELLLDQPDRRPDEGLATELRGCAECRTEFDALKATLRVTARMRETSAPAETYWTGYQERLRHKLNNAAQTPARPSSRLLRVLRSSVPVPVPVAAAIIIASAIFIPMAIKAARQRAIERPEPVVVRVPGQVPVIHEKTVTRVVYRERRSFSRNPTRTSDDQRVNNAFARSQKPRSDIPASLTGFKPTEEIKLTVIKGGSPNEK